MTSLRLNTITLISSLLLSTTGAWAQEASNASPLPVEQSASAPKPYVAPPWTYKTRQLNRQEVDTLLGRADKLIVLDLRRPDELVKYGSFAVYLNVQLKDLPYALDYIPKDRVILTVSNRAHRAGAAGDLLSSKGYKVAGAVGSEDYREAGGHIIKVQPVVRNAAK